ncbi:MAG: DUF2520 domain-containing protein [Pseudothermotoga sp.]
MVINIVGTSKVALVVCKTLVEGYDFSVGYVLSRSKERAISFVQKLGAGTPVNYEDEFTLKDIVFIAVPDSFIKPVYLQLKNKIDRDALIYHFSGFLSSDVFEGATGRGSIHPNLAFADEEVAFKMIRSCCFGIEGNERGLSRAREMVKKISGCWVEIPQDAKIAYHLAAVIASNFSVGLAYLAKKMYELHRMDGFEKIIPQLMLNTVENISKLGVENSLTGPVARGDWSVVEAEGVLFEKSFPEYGQIYKGFVDLLREISKGVRR